MLVLGIYVFSFCALAALYGWLTEGRTGSFIKYFISCVIPIESWFEEDK